ncbi:hypothetical protein BJX99DRAFT_272046 [Aspergillus californicus]
MVQESSASTRRVSLACAPCRSKHLRCDATTPVCARCCAEGLQCVYLKSRRGGRRRSAPTQVLLDNTQSVQGLLPTAGVLDDALNISLSQLASADRSASEPATGGSIISDTVSDSSLSEQFLTQYYAFFHSAHPCVLPLWAMKRRMVSDGRSVQALVAVMQYIGSVFAKSIMSESLKLEADQAVVSIGAGLITGFDVQAVLLFSIAVYWGDDAERALGLLDRAIAMAVELGMNRQEFACENGNNDQLLEECWRRTWWQIYLTDAHIAGSTHTFPFRTSNVEVTVDLPCDESDYESGKIPTARSLADYDMREFMDDTERGFSSLAELVGLTRALDLALAARQDMDISNAPVISANADASVTAWRSLLPASKKTSYIVDIHRQLSTLAYSPIEEIAHCTPPAPPESLRGCKSLECQLHTAKVLRAIDQFDDLLTLPTDIATHTPFIICMIANTVIAHLSACRFHYTGQPLRLARERIRLSMGALKVLGEYWPMGLRTYKEVGVVAREILGLKDRGREKEGVTLALKTVPPVDTELDIGLPDFSVSMGQSYFDEMPDMQFLDAGLDFCGLFDVNIPSMGVV